MQIDQLNNRVKTINNLDIHVSLLYTFRVVNVYNFDNCHQNLVLRKNKFAI